MSRAVEEVTWDEDAAEKSGFPTFMLKEIHEQPDAVAETIADRLPELDRVDLSELELDRDYIAGLRRIVIACGTATTPACRALRDRAVGEGAGRDGHRLGVLLGDPVVGPEDLVIGITQSGETADTLAAMRLARERGAKVLAITNIMGARRRATRTRSCTRAPGLRSGSRRRRPSSARSPRCTCSGCGSRRSGGPRPPRPLTPDRRAQVDSDGDRRFLESVDEVRVIARSHHEQKFFLYLGRNIGLPVCLEGALKLKEISYILTDAYAAGEMKHGPIALLDDSTPVVCVATDSPVLEKVLSNVAEVRAAAPL